MITFCICGRYWLLHPETRELLELEHRPTRYVGMA